MGHLVLDPLRKVRFGKKILKGNMLTHEHSSVGGRQGDGNEIKPLCTVKTVIAVFVHSSQYALAIVLSEPLVTWLARKSFSTKCIYLK